MVFDISQNKSTKMAKSEYLYNSCKAINPELKENDFRINIDLAFRIVGEYQERTKNKVEEPIRTSDHAPCHDCGGIFFLRTGTCHVCQTCGCSQGCS